MGDTASLLLRKGASDISAGHWIPFCDRYGQEVLKDINLLRCDAVAIDDLISPNQRHQRIIEQID